MRSPANNDAQDSLTIGIADEQIGAVVGRAGRISTEINQVVSCAMNSTVITFFGAFFNCLIPCTYDCTFSFFGYKRHNVFFFVVS